MEENNDKKIFVPRSEDSVRRESVRINSMKEQLEWIKRQIEYATFTDRYKLRKEMKKGEIYEIDFGVNVNAEFSNRHYGVVLKDSSEYDPLVIVCPIKTNKHGAHPASDIDLGIIKELSDVHPSLAVINQVRTIDKVRIYSKNAIASSNFEDNKIVTLEPKKVEMILTAYLNLIRFGSIH